MVAPNSFGLGLSSNSFESEVVPDTAHTRLPESAAKESIPEPFTARICWLALKYTVEKATFFLRSQVIE